MEIRGGSVNGDGTQNVSQRIYDDAGGHTDRLAGRFTYHEHHAHIHFDGYAQYRLRQILPGDGVGSVVADGGKISFCLIDVDEWSSDLPGSPASARYTSCGQIQGISVGWTDVYDRSLPDQWIDVTGVASGTYWLEVESDPDNNLRESDETNNVARIKVTIGSPSGDRFETNESFATAADLGTVGDLSEEGLSIHAANNDDYFRVVAARNGTLNVDLSFVDARGDIDLRVYDANQTRIGRSEGTSDQEHVSVPVVAGQTYYIRVMGYNDATNPDYDLIIDGPDIPGDRFESNDDFASATDWGMIGSRREDALSIGDEHDEDFFRFVAAESGPLHVDVTFKVAQGNLDLALFAADESLLTFSSSLVDGESLSHEVVAGETYYVRVIGFNHATNPDYDIVVRAPQSSLPVVSMTMLDGIATEVVSGTTADQGRIRVKRTGPTTEPLVVNLYIGGTATSDVDFKVLPPTVTIPAGATYANVTIRPRNNSTAEPSETVVCGIEPGTGYFADGAERSAAVFIHDDDVPAASTNNSFSARRKVSGSTVTAFGSNVGATAQSGEPAHGGATATNSVWWTWTAPTSGAVAITTSGSTFDTTLGVYTGSSVSGLTLVAGNDDDSSSTGIWTSRATFNAVAGRVYQIAVAGDQGAAGTIRLNISPSSSSRPGNNAFDMAAAIAGASAVGAGTTINASSQSGEPAHSGVPSGNSVWFSWTAPVTRAFTISTLGSDFDTVLAAYTGAAVTALVNIADNNDESATVHTSRITINAVAGEIYHFAVAGVDGTAGGVLLMVSS
jgi:hypothetical protein